MRRSATLLVLAAVALRLRGRPVFRGASQPPTDASLGIAGRGVHRWRVVDVASYDMFFSIVAAIVLAWISRGSTTAWLVIVLVVAEVQHAQFGIPTSTQRWLFGYD